MVICGVSSKVTYNYWLAAINVLQFMRKKINTRKIQKNLSNKCLKNYKILM